MRSLHLQTVSFIPDILLPVIYAFVSVILIPGDRPKLLFESASSFLGRGLPKLCIRSFAFKSLTLLGACCYKICSINSIPESYFFKRLDWLFPCLCGVTSCTIFVRDLFWWLGLKH